VGISRFREALTTTQSHSTHYALLSAEQHAHFRGELRLLTRSSDEMLTKASRILVLVSVIRSNFRHILVSSTKVSNFYSFRQHADFHNMKIVMLTKTI